MNTEEPVVIVCLCQKCKERPATMTWVGDGGVLAWSHGLFENWCEVCVLMAQLDAARAAAVRITQIQKRLSELGIA